MTRDKKKDYAARIKEWEYAYCPGCDRIRYEFELEATKSGIRCSRCGGTDLEAPAWVFCPHAMFVAATKCPRGGLGIVEGRSGRECSHRCAYRRR